MIEYNLIKLIKCWVGKFEFNKPKEKKVDNSPTKEKHSILINSKKWVKENEIPTLRKELINDFNKTASEACLTTGNFKLLNQNVNVVDIKEKYKFFSNEEISVFRLKIEGSIECG